MYKFKNHDMVVDKVCTSIQQKERIAVYGDHDTDGLMSLMVFKEMFKTINYKDIFLYPYSFRTHDIEPEFEKFCYANKIELAIICDTGSSDLELITRLTNKGIECVILDHHKSVYNYEDFPKGAYIINTQFDMAYNITNEMCGGGISFVIVNAVLHGLNIEHDRGYFATYGLIAQYADMIPMDTEFARTLYQLVENRKTTPFIIGLFLEGKSKITKRFIEFTLAPKMNAAFRREEFELINNLFLFDKQNHQELVERLKELHSDTIAKVSSVLDSINHEEINNILLANLSPLLKDELPRNFIVNHKGRIANSLANKYKKTCLCVCDNGERIEGSLRDCSNRNLIKYFIPQLKGGGHQSAFGFSVEYNQWEYFKTLIESVDLEEINNSIGSNCDVTNKIINMTTGIDILLLQQVAYENEFCSITSPPTYIKLFFTPQRESTKYGYSYLLWSDGISSVWLSSSKQITEACEIVIKPYMYERIKTEVVW